MSLLMRSARARRMDPTIWLCIAIHVNHLLPVQCFGLLVNTLTRFLHSSDRFSLVLRLPVSPRSLSEVPLLCWGYFIPLFHEPGSFRILISDVSSNDAGPLLRTGAGYYFFTASSIATRSSLSPNGFKIKPSGLVAFARSSVGPSEWEVRKTTGSLNLFFIRLVVSIPSISPLILISMRTRSGRSFSSNSRVSAPEAARPQTSYPRFLSLQEMILANMSSSSTISSFTLVMVSPHSE